MRCSQHLNPGFCALPPYDLAPCKLPLPLINRRSTLAHSPLLSQPPFNNHLPSEKTCDQTMKHKCIFCKEKTLGKLLTASEHGQSTKLSEKMRIFFVIDIPCIVVRGSGSLPFHGVLISVESSETRSGHHCSHWPHTEISSLHRATEGFRDKPWWELAPP